MTVIKWARISAVIGILFPFNLFAQDYQRVTEIEVFKDGSQMLSPWTGGLNATQVAEADFNNDGRTDLFFYDEDGQWKNVFINLQDDTYIYEPSYAEAIPRINDWLLMADYNCDGITDLITHGSGSPRTYSGFYENGRLQFELDHTIIFYETSSGFSVNLYTIGTHRPIFKDVNGDGDRDFLSFDVSLLRIYYYENLRIEENIPCDSVYFKRIDRCWGNVKETGISLALTLEDTCDFKFNRLADDVPGNVAHPGGTVIDLYDEDKDGVYDLLLSDATFERINFLRNNGTAQVSNLFEQDEFFPVYDEPVDMAIFPIPYVCDVDKDGDEDLLVTPFNAGAIDNYKNVWYYKNDGSDFQPFSLESKDFIVGDMIDVGETADAAFYDYNGDDLEDLVIGNGGYFEGQGNYLFTLTLYENTGSSTLPEYTYVERDYLDLSTLGLDDITPFFGDLDGDNDKDLIAGSLSGKILVMDNSGGNFVNPRFLKDNMNNDIDIGQSSNPILYDLDGNGSLDLIIGNRDGTLYYYENTGTVNNAIFTYRTDTLGGVVAHPDNSLLKYSSPAIGDFDDDGQMDLLLGGADRRVKFYSNIGIDYNVIYTETSGNFFDATNFNLVSGDVRPRLNPAVADISSDGKAEVVLGVNTGGLMLYSQDLADTNSLATNYQMISDQVQAWPNPATERLFLEWNSAFELKGEVTITINDLVGRLIHRQTVPDIGSSLIDVEGLPSGIYLATMQNGNRMGAVRFIKY